MFCKCTSEISPSSFTYITAQTNLSRISYRKCCKANKLHLFRESPFTTVSLFLYVWGEWETWKYKKITYHSLAVTAIFLICRRIFNHFITLVSWGDFFPGSDNIQCLGKKLKISLCQDWTHFWTRWQNLLASILHSVVIFSFTCNQLSKNFNLSIHVLCLNSMLNPYIVWNCTV